MNEGLTTILYGNVFITRHTITFLCVYMDENIEQEASSVPLFKSAVMVQFSFLGLGSCVGGM